MSHAGMPSICNLLALSGATVDPTATHKLNEEKLDVCKGCLICSGSGYLIDGLTARYKSTDMTQWHFGKPEGEKKFNVTLVKMMWTHHKGFLTVHTCTLFVQIVCKCERTLRAHLKGRKSRPLTSKQALHTVDANSISNTTQLIWSRSESECVRQQKHKHTNCDEVSWKGTPIPRQDRWQLRGQTSQHFTSVGQRLAHVLNTKT